MNLRTSLGISSLLAGVLAMAGAVPTVAQVPKYTFSHLAGTTGGPGSADGNTSAARLNTPSGLALDAGGNLYVADQGNATIRKMAPDGTVTTMAGSPGQRGGADGTGSAARFQSPADLALDSAGNLYVADYGNDTIRKVTPSGVVTTLAGSAGYDGSSDGTGTAARFSGPASLAMDSAGNLYVADYGNDTIRKVSPAGIVTTFAGSPRQQGSADGTGSAARFFYPSGVRLDVAGNVYVTDTMNDTVRKMTPQGAVSTLAGTAGQYGGANGTGSAARFFQPVALAVDGSGNLYVSDGANETIRKVTAAGVVTTVAGTRGMDGYADGNSTTARFSGPEGLVVDGSGNVLLADSYNDTIRRIAPDGTVSTVAGLAAAWGSTDGDGGAARFSSPWGIAADATGNLYVADTNNDVIRKITAGGVVSTLAGAAGQYGAVDGLGSAARFSQPTGVAVDASGNVYVADLGNDTIRKITSNGVVTTVAGSAGMNGSADGVGTNARFYSPSGVAVDAAGDLYVADEANETIRKITPDGAVTTLAGTPGVSRFADGTGPAAGFPAPFGIAVDSSGNVYVADWDSNTIRKITPAAVVTTVAGNAFALSGGVDGTGSAARFTRPYGVAVDSAGNLYVADTGNSTIRQITPAGVVSTLGGTAGWLGGADGIGSGAQFNSPGGLAVDANGSLYVADTGNHCIRMGVVATTAPTIQTQPQSQTVAAGASAQFSVTASGTPAPTYQWLFNGAAISGATGSSYSVANAQAANAGDYTVAVSNSQGSVTSNKATLTVTAATPPPSSGSGSGGGGGGAMPVWFVVALVLIAAARLRRIGRHRRPYVR